MTFKRRVLSALGKDELLALGRGVGLTVATRLSVDELRDAIARSRRASVGVIVRETLSRDTLKTICEACGVKSAGREKQTLVERIIAAGGKESGSFTIDPDGVKRSIARQGSATLGPQLGLDFPASRPTKTQTKAQTKPQTKMKDRRRAGADKSEAFVSGSLKAALRQFAIGAAGGYRGRDAHVSFTTHLLECFGWKDGRPDGAEIPRLVAIAEGGQRLDREVALWWPERRVLLEVAPHDAVLDSEWKDLVRVCLQLDPTPQYVLLTNQRDLRLYDLAREREAPRLAIPIDDLPKYSEALPFFTTYWIPGTIPRIVNVEKVSAEVADLVAKLYRSVRAQHPKREQEVIRFTLQCITAMFAEDIGLLPKSYFTSLLYDGAGQGNVEHRLHDLFTQMNMRDLPTPRAVPYFNGGLFTDIVSLTLGSEQVVALTKAAEANWTYVDPHIFGSVFQGIMNDAERHASGAHYTAHDDIMRVVAPTIVEPWRKRIHAANSLKELTEVRAELFRYRVLDPACGSGNFLYVAFRELYRLDTELLSRMREFPSTHAKLSWNGGIQTTNFFGIDINPFAVELAKVTLNIAKKIAFEERNAQALALAGQVEMDIDPSLPLDNLDKNIVCADALFADWPKVDAIVGNPPFLGASKIRGELGPEYVRKLQEETEAKAVVDLVCYWFRRAHDHLPEGARAGLVATSGIRVGKQREASLDYIVSRGATITNAVSSRAWPGESAVNVSMVNWVRGSVDGPHQLVVEGDSFSLSIIPTHLQLHADVSATSDLAANARGMNEGVNFGHQAFRSDSVGFPLAERDALPSIRPVATADDMLRGRLSKEPDYCIYLSYSTEDEARARGGVAFEHLKKHVFPVVKGRAESGQDAAIHASWIRRWWQPWAPRTDFFAGINGYSRLLVTPKVSSRPSFAFLSTRFVPSNTLKIFAFEDDYSFGTLQSRLHWEWTKAKGNKVRSDIQYSTAVWQTFPWPQDPTEQQVAKIAGAGRELRRVRSELMEQNDWSLRTLYQAAEVEGPHPLKAVQAALDVAVSDAYGVPSDQDSITFLLELNQLVAEDEQHGRKVRGPGVPDHLDPKDPRWTSTDCIEPPPVDN
jgi:SAM-dependent methyltransferase